MKGRKDTKRGTKAFRLAKRKVRRQVHGKEGQARTFRNSFDMCGTTTRRRRWEQLRHASRACTASPPAGDLRDLALRRIPDHNARTWSPCLLVRDGM
jgi:hypothetical protein